MISELLWQCCIFLHVSVQDQESELLCICVLGESVFASVLGFYCMILELFWQCGIFFHDFGTALTVVFPTWFLNCSDSVVFPTWFLNCSHSVVFPTSFRSYSDSVVFFYMISELFSQCSISYIVSELFWQCCVFLHDFVTALTMLYFSTCFSTRFQNCSDSVVFFYKILELFWQCCIFYMCLYKARKVNCHVFVC